MWRADVSNGSSARTRDKVGVSRHWGSERFRGPLATRSALECLECRRLFGNPYPAITPKVWTVPLSNATTRGSGADRSRLAMAPSEVWWPQ